MIGTDPREFAVWECHTEPRTGKAGCGATFRARKQPDGGIVCPICARLGSKRLWGDEVEIAAKR